VSHRDARFVMKIAAPAADAITASATGGSFLNFLHDTTRTHTAFTPENYHRLREVKTAYDPANFFHRNHNIPPVG
jgi:FAD/FMN-containing dehydrogenase